MLALRVLGHIVAMVYKGRFPELVPPPLVSMERLVEVGADRPIEALFAYRIGRQRLVRGDEGARGDPLLKLLETLYVGPRYACPLAPRSVYALLRLAVDADRLGIRPDYDSAPGTTERILIEVARGLIEKGGPH